MVKSYPCLVDGGILASSEQCASLKTFEARELCQLLAVQPPYLSRCSTLTLVGSYSARALKHDVRSSAQCIQWNPLNGTPGACLSLYRQRPSQAVYILCISVLLTSSDHWRNWSHLRTSTANMTENMMQSLHTHKYRKHKNTQPGVYKIPCECGQSLHRGNREKLQHKN